MLSFWVFFRCLFYLLCACTAFGKVVLIGSNVTSSFQDIEANFAPSVKGSGIYGTLYVADPLGACSPLTNKIDIKMDDTRYPFALIIRGVCSFDEKVRRAQVAGFKAAIIYDDEDGDLVAMAGNSTGIKINAVFVSKASGETLAKYDGAVDTEIWISPVYENSAWAVMAISFISLLAMSAVLAICFFIRRHRIRREQPQAPRLREFHGMSRRLVKAMPSLTFTAVLEDNCTSSTCAICLEDYNIGEKLRILPCSHKFHAVCVDAWLTSWRTFCPVCKRDARTSTGEPPASESTPLLSSSPVSSTLASFRLSLASSSAMQIGQSPLQSTSFPCPQSISTTPYSPYYHQSPNLSASRSSSLRSSLASSPAMQIGRSPLQSTSFSRPQSISTTPYNPYYHQSPNSSTSRSSVDLRIMSSQRSLGSYLISPHSLGYHTTSPLNSRYMSPYIPSPSDASSSYIGSSSRPPNPLHYSESAASFSPFASAQSLPGC